MLKRVIRILSGYLASGVILMAVATVMLGCAPSLDDVAVPAFNTEGTAPASLREAETAKNHAVLRENIDIWSREQAATQKDAFVEALATYRIGAASEDYQWTYRSLLLFDAILEEDADFTLARAWRGAANATYAQDHRIKKALFVIYVPEFIPLDYVWRSFRDLNQAVKAAPNDPMIRLIRASTFIRMPELFSGHDEGMEDFALLDGWTNDPSTNPQNADLLATAEWRSQYFLNRARAMERLENTTEAERAWKNLLQESNDQVDQELARWHLK